MKESDQKDHRVLRSIKPVNLLSFGPETPALELEALNVFIGPNGSGKSNLIEALALMRATPYGRNVPSSGDVRGVLRRAGRGRTGSGYGRAQKISQLLWS